MKKKLTLSNGTAKQGDRITDGINTGTLKWQDQLPSANRDLWEGQFRDAGHWWILWDDGDDTLVLSPGSLYLVEN